MEHFDTIIIGAGLAGCTLGSLLMEKGKKVLILEKQDLKNKEKLCGGIITSKAYNLLIKIYGVKVKELNFFEFNSFKVKNKETIKEIKHHPVYSINRKDLDDFVVKYFTLKGGKILDNTKYDKIDFKNKIIITKRGKYQYDNLVGADGVFSKVRYDITNRNQKRNFALEASINQRVDKIQIDFIDNFAGYAWFIPNDKTTLIGIGNISQNKNIVSLFLEHFDLKASSSIRGSFLPTGNDICLKRKNTYFIGDAAGLISPAIGEGIYYALSSAYNLSKSMNNLYSLRMIKDRLIIVSHRTSKKLIYNTRLRNIFFNLYGKSKIASFLVNLALRTLL